jgi:hypothetical protein
VRWVDFGNPFSSLSSVIMEEKIIMFDIPHKLLEVIKSSVDAQHEINTQLQGFLSKDSSVFL